MDIDIAAYPPSKDLEKKAPSEFASTVMAVAFVEGAGLGYHFPEQFKEYWENTYQVIPDSRWQEMRAFGVTLPEKQESRRSVEEAVADMAANASDWVNAEAPGLLIGGTAAGRTLQFVRRRRCLRAGLVSSARWYPGSWPG